MLKAQGKYDEALKCSKEDVRIKLANGQQKHANYASSLVTTGSIQSAQGEYKAALESYEEALAVYKEAVGDEHPSVAATLSNMGKVSAAGHGLSV